MKIGIDLDNCITSEQEFFRIITHLLHPEYEIHIITNRDESNRQSTIQELEQLRIQYSKLELTAEKAAAYILNQGINIFFDDTDEYFLQLPEQCDCF